nr:MAG TPA: hypothetical protein [Caudoviricetes sp.]
MDKFQLIHDVQPNQLKRVKYECKLPYYLFSGF